MFRNSAIFALALLISAALPAQSPAAPSLPENATAALTAKLLATGSEAALIGLGLLNALFVSLAAGLWMSTVFRERRYALPATLALVAALAFSPR